MARNRFADRSQPWPGSSRSARVGERLVAIFFFGLVAFTPLVISIFDQGPTTTLLGLPLLYFYLFAVWGTLIALVAWTIEGRHRRVGRPTDKARTPKDQEGVRQ